MSELTARLAKFALTLEGFGRAVDAGWADLKKTEPAIALYRQDSEGVQAIVSLARQFSAGSITKAAYRDAVKAVVELADERHPEAA